MLLKVEFDSRRIDVAKYHACVEEVGETVVVSLSKGMLS